MAWQTPGVATADDVRAIASALPGAYERESYNGTPSYRTKPRMFARILESGGEVALWVADEAEKQALVRSELDKFFTTAHYHGHPVVLVRLSAVDTDELRELVTESWRLRAPARDVRAHEAAAAPRGVAMSC